MNIVAKWLRITESQYLGFWAIGLLLFVLQEVPYLMMPLFKLETNPIMNMQETSVFLDVCEKTLGSLCIFLMLFMVHKDIGVLEVGSGIAQIGFTLTIAVLLLNYFGWWLYFHGHQSIGIMMFFIVVLPPLYYVCIGFWRQNRLLVFTGIIFLAVHFMHVLGNLKQ